MSGERTQPRWRLASTKRSPHSSSVCASWDEAASRDAAMALAYGRAIDAHVPLLVLEHVMECDVCVERWRVLLNDMLADPDFRAAHDRHVCSFLITLQRLYDTP